MKRFLVITMLVSGLAFGIAAANATRSQTAPIDHTTIDLLNGILNGRWIDSDIQKCLSDFRALEADVISGNVVAPKKNEDSWIYNLQAERNVVGGTEFYHLTIEHFEGGYSCNLVRVK